MDKDPTTTPHTQQTPEQAIQPPQVVEQTVIQTEDRFNHSGSSALPPEMQETPFRHFRETTLEEAHEQELIETPHNANDVTPTDIIEVITPKKSIRNKVIAVIAGLSLAGGIGAGVTAMNQPPKSEPVATAPAEPNAEAPAPPAEAKDFLEAYAGQYEDPLATYYAVTALEEASGGQGFTFGEDYVNNYSYESLQFNPDGTSPLGFSILQVEPGETVNTENSIKQFNDSIPTLNRLLNLLSKNPSQEQVNVIHDEFLKSTGYQSSWAEGLFSKMLSVTAKYGSIANYSINTATDASGASEQSNTMFHPDKTPSIDAVDADNTTIAFSNVIDLSIAVESFDNTNKETRSTEVLKQVQFSVVRAVNDDPFDVGLVGIGLSQ